MAKITKLEPRISTTVAIFLIDLARLLHLDGVRTHYSQYQNFPLSLRIEVIP